MSRAICRGQMLAVHDANATPMATPEVNGIETRNAGEFFIADCNVVIIGLKSKFQGAI